jgi:hypothetical protein
MLNQSPADITASVPSFIRTAARPVHGPAEDPAGDVEDVERPQRELAALPGIVRPGELKAM